MLQLFLRINVYMLLLLTITGNIIATDISTANKKIFFSTGAVSGDSLCAWHYKKIKQNNSSLQAEGIAGEALKQEGATLLMHFNDVEATHLTATTGILSRITKIPATLSFANKIATYIVEKAFDEVVLVDFPFFNIPLARALKKLKPTMHITYIAPPELWFWRMWGMQYPLKWYCDRIIVLYPFEKTWYKEHFDLSVEWLGYPFYDALQVNQTESSLKQNTIALIPGSRMHEVQITMPLLASFAQSFSQKHPEVTFVLTLAETIDHNIVHRELIKHNINHLVTIIADREQQHKSLCTCCLAICKPGTITLELGLLLVPSIVMCKVSWITYLISTCFVRQSYVSLPNIFLGDEVFVELFQGDCSVQQLILEAEKLYQSFLHADDLYQKKLHQLALLNIQFLGQPCNYQVP